MHWKRGAAEDLLLFAQGYGRKHTSGITIAGMLTIVSLNLIMLIASRW